MATPKPRRIYHHYERLEEYAAGMWRMVTGDERKQYADAAAVLMKDPERFKASMLRAVDEWRYSGEHNLTSMASNRIAWLGHAGCCIAVQAPEDVTRQAWWTLTKRQQDEANRVAAEALAVWDARHAERSR